MARAPKPAVPKQVVTVRMYKNLLGDCFLLRIVEKQKTAHILIDCGILQNVAGDRETMQAVAASVVADTNGHLDLLVVTHEHHDHISGFAHAADTFFSDHLTIGNLWMAWTENERDPQAQALNARFNTVKQAVSLAAGRAATMAAAGVSEADDLLVGLQNFIGVVEMPDDPPGATERLTGRVIMRKLKEKVREKGVEPRFLEPGTVLDTPGAASLRAHVLGPPRTPERLFQDLPTRSSGEAHETYLGKRFAAADDLLSVVVDPSRPFGESPFPPRFALTEAEVRKGGDTASDWINAHYYGGETTQKVETEWLGSAGALALKLDSDTNNTSLALAFEMRDGRILIFAADAQVGNWLSWHDQDYGEPPVKAADLLRRTVFYKVGHHASHNATLRDDGLELMNGGDLVAMIPVVETVARAQGSKGWNMPYPPLLARLNALTRNRVIRGDEPTDVARFPPGRLRTHKDDLWVEYDVRI